jgi:hypothetical protein
MKKNPKKLSLNQETVRTLTPAVPGRDPQLKTTAITCTCTTTAIICGTA